LERQGELLTFLDGHLLSVVTVCESKQLLSRG
jgi:hypothetical protein